MDLVNLKCATCEALFGSINNLWVRIGKNYLSSTARPEAFDSFWIKTSGAARCGEADTIIGGCELQDVMCKSCDANLGLKCLDTPADHDLQPDQIIFRSSSIYIRSVTDQRRKVEPKIERSLSLRQSVPTEESSEEPILSPSPAPGLFAGFNLFNDAASNDSVDLNQLQVDLDAQREDIQKIGNTGMQIVSNFEDSMGDVKSKMRELEGLVGELKKDRWKDYEQTNEVLTSLRQDLEDMRWECPYEHDISRIEQQAQETDETVTELRDSVEKTQCDTADLGRDQSRFQEDVSQMKIQNDKLQKDLAETKKLAKECLPSAKGYAKRSEALQKEISEMGQVAEESVASAKEYSSEVTLMRKELKQLRADLAKERSERQQSETERQRMERERPVPTPTAAAGFPSRELDILTSRISKIGNQAHQVESLQMEFELFKSRVQRLETSGVAANALVASPSRAVERTQGATDAYTMGLLEDESPSVHVRASNSQKRKRPSAVEYVEEDDAMDLPTERPEFTSDYYSAATTGSSSTGDGQDSSPWTATTTAGDFVLRRTKNGAIDKRSLRKAKRMNALREEMAPNS